MAVFCNPDTLQAIRRPADMADELKAHGFVLVEPAKTADKPKKADKADKGKDQSKE